MNRVVQMLRTPAVALERFDHEPGVAHRDPDRECSTAHRVNFVEAGSFRVRTTAAWRTFSRASLFVTRPGLEFSCGHDEDQPSDCCFSVSFSVEAVESARSSIALADDVAHPLTNRSAFLHRALRTCRPGDEARTEALPDALLWSLAASEASPASSASSKARRRTASSPTSA